VFNCLKVDILEVVIASLLFGTFLHSLKKSNLDKTILSNYRPISNLPFTGKIIEKVVFKNTDTSHGPWPGD